MWCRTEDDRRFMTPAVWVAVLIRVMMQQRAFFFQHFQHRIVGFKYMLTRKQLSVWQIYAV
ncbi:Uncharacterised protein [Vibrio cholerae]|nr:Uncharacterised protein [Vibrio cholerae]